MTAEKKKSRRWIKVLIAFVLLLGLGWYFGKQFLDIDRYRALAATEIEKRTGLPAEIGPADLRLWPSPRLVLDGVIIGSEGFRIQTDRVDAEASLRQLFSGEVNISEISIGETIIDLPADNADLSSRIQAIRETYMSASDTSSGNSNSGAMALAVSMGQINADSWLLRRGGEDIVRGSAKVANVLSGTPEITLALAYAPTQDTSATSVITLDLSGDSPTISGDINFSASDLWALAGQTGKAPLHATASGTLSGTLPNKISLDLDGTLDAPQTPALTGKFLAKAWYADGQIIVNDIIFDAPALKAKADFTRDTEGSLNFAVSEASLNAEGITLATAFTPISDQFNLGGANASLRINNLLGTFSDSTPRLVRGNVSVENMRVARPGSELVLNDVSGNARFEENTITIEKLSAPGLDVSGTVSPNLETKAVSFDLRTGITLDDTLLAMLYPVTEVQNVGGRVDLKRIAGTWKPGLSLPEGFVVEGTISDAKANLTYPSFKDKVSGGSATFKSDGKTVKATLKATSETHGPIEGNADVDIAEKTVSGILNLDIARAAQAYVPESEYAATASAVLRAYGNSRLEYKLDLPNEESTSLHLVTWRQGAPSLDAALELTSSDSGMTISSLAVRGDVDLALAKDILPEEAYARGWAAVSVEVDPDFESLNVDVDLARTTVGYATYFEKAEDIPLSTKIHLAKKDDSFSLESLNVECLGENVIFKQGPNGLHADDFSIQLASLKPMLDPGISPRGTVRGSVTIADSPVVSLRFEDAAASLPQGIDIDSLNGAVSGGGGTWTCTDLTLVGLNSDATFNGTLKDNTFNASVRGKRVDANALMGLAALVNKETTPEATEVPESTSVQNNRGTPAGRPNGRQSTPSAANSSRLQGEAIVDVAALAYGNGEINDLNAKVRMSSGVVTVENLTCRPKSGSLTGNIQYDTSAGTMVTKLNFQNADISIIDAMFLETPRGLEGTASGMVDLRLTGESGKGPLSGLNGDVVFAAKSGSYGKFGIATKLLGVLRATQILQLSRPKLGQRGLVFEESNGELVIQDGVLNIRKFNLSEPSYTIDASGYIDLPNDDMSAVVRASIFDTVTGIVAAVPGLRNATEKIRQKTALKITLSGSPRNPNVKEEHGASVLEEGTEGAKETVRTTEEVVRDGLRQILERVQQ